MEKWGWNTGNATENEDRDNKDWPYLLTFLWAWSCSLGLEMLHADRERWAPVRGLAPSGGRCPASIWNV